MKIKILNTEYITEGNTIIGRTFNAEPFTDSGATISTQEFAKQGVTIPGSRGETTWCFSDDQYIVISKEGRSVH